MEALLQAMDVEALSKTVSTAGDDPEAPRRHHRHGI